MSAQSYLSASAGHADFADGDSDDLSVVQLDGLVVLKIIKHCQDHLPDIVTGQLLGLDVKHAGSPEVTLEVTNCFPFPSRTDDQEEESDDAGAEYQLEMMRCLRQVNVDYNTVGWYTSTYLGSFLNESLVDTQFNYQTTIKKCVVIVFDPVKTSQGVLSLRAYRLTQVFMDMYANKQQNFTKEILDNSNMTFNDIFEEVPIRIHKPQLINALLYDMEGSDILSAHFERLNLGFGPFLEKNLEFLAESLDDLAAEQSKFQYYQKSVQRQQAQIQAHRQKRSQDGVNVDEEEITSLFKPPQQPSRLESLLITNQINKYCEQINKFAGTSFTKLFLYTGLQK
jgi:translation initiation factor 3 subunit H